MIQYDSKKMISARARMKEIFKLLLSFHFYERVLSLHTFARKVKVEKGETFYDNTCVYLSKSSHYPIALKEGTKENVFRHYRKKIVCFLIF